MQRSTSLCIQISWSLCNTIQVTHISDRYKLFENRCSSPRDSHMPPKPIEDIDFPAEGNKLLELLLALWTLIYNICLALWDGVSQAFLAAWTYPPFESFRNEFAAALIGLMEYGASRPSLA